MAVRRPAICGRRPGCQLHRAAAAPQLLLLRRASVLGAAHSAAPRGQAAAAAAGARRQALLRQLDAACACGGCDAFVAVSVQIGRLVLTTMAKSAIRCVWKMGG